MASEIFGKYDRGFGILHPSQLQALLTDMNGGEAVSATEVICKQPRCNICCWCHEGAIFRTKSCVWQVDLVLRCAETGVIDRDSLRPGLVLWNLLRSQQEAATARHQASLPIAIEDLLLELNNGVKLPAADAQWILHRVDPTGSNECRIHTVQDLRAAVALVRRLVSRTAGIVMLICSSPQFFYRNKVPTLSLQNMG